MPQPEKLEIATGANGIRLARTPDGTLHQFPADATDKEIGDALGGTQKTDANVRTSKSQNGWVDATAEWLPAIGGMIGGITGGIGGTAFGMGVGGVPGGVGGATLGAAAGEAGKQLLNRARGAGGPATSGEAAKRIASEGVTSGLVPEAVGAGVGAIGKPVAKAVMKSAVGRLPAKVIESYRTSTKEVADQLLKNGINVTRRGLDKLDSLIHVKNSEIDALIGGLKGKIDPRAVARRTGETIEQEIRQVNPVSDVSSVRGAASEFLDEHPWTGRQAKVGTQQVQTGILDQYGQPITKSQDVMGRIPKKLTPTEAQELKKGTYQQLRRKRAFSEPLAGASSEALMALADGLREELESLAQRQGLRRGQPAVVANKLQALNEQERKLLASKSAIASKLLTQEHLPREGMLWIAQHPLIALYSVANIEGAPLRSVIAQVFNGQTLRHVSSNAVRLATVALSSQADQEQEQPTP
jgi:hypothetical protein